jgi:beta-lactamase regulating signal transducer with metallopeptidase domain
VETLETSVLTYVANATWQVAAVAIAAFLCARLLRNASAKHIHAIWVVGLCLSALLPLLTLYSGRAESNRTVDIPISNQVEASRPHLISSLGPQSHRKSLSFDPLVARILLSVYLSWCFYAAGRLVWAWRRTVHIHASSRIAALPDNLRRIVRQLNEEFGCAGTIVLTSPEVLSPITLGFRRPLLVLPENFAIEAPEKDFLSAICHELAHIQRKDFTLNLLYEVLSLPIAFHPVIAIIKSCVDQTREFACDDLAALHSVSRATYARSLVNIAQLSSGAREPGRSGYALGLFDTRKLEKRVLRLLDRPDPSADRWPAFLGAAASTLMVFAILATPGFSLQVRDRGEQVARSFAGTWVGEFHGRTFLTLTLKENAGKLAGTCVHAVDMAEDANGQLIRIADKRVLDPVVDARVSGTDAVLAIGAAGDPHKVAKFDLRLIGESRAEMRPVHHPENSVTTEWWDLHQEVGK